MATWLNFPFDPELFSYYWGQQTDFAKTALIDSGAMVEDERIAALIQNGSDTFTIPSYDVLDDTTDPENYDGSTDITTTALTGRSENGIVYGRAHGFAETEFVRAFNSGANPMEATAVQTYKWWRKNEQKTLLGIVDAVLGVSALSGHTVTTGDTLAATDLKDAAQQVFGDSRDMISLAIMHSAAMRKLEQLDMLEYMKYTNPQGIQSNTNIAQVEGNILAIEWDGVPYTPASGETPTSTDIYLFKRGALGHASAPVPVPVEVSRDPKENGGENYLWMRNRQTIHPYGMSFSKPNSGYTSSPTYAQLSASARWSLAAADDKSVGIMKLTVEL